VGTKTGSYPVFKPMYLTTDRLQRWPSEPTHPTSVVHADFTPRALPAP